MQNSTTPDQTRRLTRFGCLLSLAAQAVPLLYSLFTIATFTLYRPPLYTEIRLVILFLGLAGTVLGVLALFRPMSKKVLAILAILLGLAAVFQHVWLCGSDALHQKNMLFCPMLWGVKIP
jgi:hypothetical protein